MEGDPHQELAARPYGASRGHPAIGTDATGVTENLVHPEMLGYNILCLLVRDGGRSPMVTGELTGQGQWELKSSDRGGLPIRTLSQPKAQTTGQHQTGTPELCVCARVCTYVCVHSCVHRREWTRVCVWTRVCGCTLGVESDRKRGVGRQRRQKDKGVCHLRTGAELKGTFLLLFPY